MPFDKVVDSDLLDAGLSSIADAIRGKSGSSDGLSFPDGMEAAINGLSSPRVEDGLIDSSLSGAYENPRVTEIKASRFNGCAALTSVSFAAVKTLGSSVFNGDSGLVSISFPLLETVGSYAFNNCTKLPKADFPKLKSIAAGGFYGTRVMTKFIIRSESVCTLADKSAFQSSAIADGTGYIYVPDDLVDSYKAAANWSTYADQIKPLSALEE